MKTLVKCPNCTAIVYADKDIAEGRRLLCPHCDFKFSYSSKMRLEAPMKSQGNWRVDVLVVEKAGDDVYDQKVDKFLLDEKSLLLKIARMLTVRIIICFLVAFVLIVMLGMLYLR